MSEINYDKAPTNIVEEIELSKNRPIKSWHMDNGFSLEVKKTDSGIILCVQRPRDNDDHEKWNNFLQQVESELKEFDLSLRECD